MDQQKKLPENRKARFHYTILETLECGLVLMGTEVKSMREGRFNYSDSYIRIIDGELIMVGFHISEYKQGNLFNHDPDRNRKLLAHKQEIKRLARKVDEKGYTLVPLNAYFKNGKLKMTIGICQGKKIHDKRASIKDRTEKRAIERSFKQKI
ncbi:MAG: SsrA-binding protein SmpB [Spirochaetales bacterium]|nr:SsrA-binding protein SmpB [Spirochaetales bacterium]